MYTISKLSNGNDIFSIEPYSKSTFLLEKHEIDDLMNIIDNSVREDFLKNPNRINYSIAEINTKQMEISFYCFFHAETFICGVMMVLSFKNIVNDARYFSQVIYSISSVFKNRNFSLDDVLRNIFGFTLKALQDSRYKLIIGSRTKDYATIEEIFIMPKFE